MINSVRFWANYLDWLVSKTIQLHQNPLEERGIAYPMCRRQSQRIWNFRFLLVKEQYQYLPWRSFWELISSRTLEMLVAFFSPSFHFLLNNFAILLLFCPPYLFPPLHSPPVRPSPPLPSCPSVLSSPVPFLPLLSHLIRICSFLPLFIPSCAFPPLSCLPLCPFPSSLARFSSITSWNFSSCPLCSLLSCFPCHLCLPSLLSHKEPETRHLLINETWALPY